MVLTTELQSLEASKWELIHQSPQPNGFARRRQRHESACPLEPGAMTAWYRLPPELKSAVLAQLPVRQRARARLVCRQWAALLDSRPWADVRRMTLDTGSVWTSGETAPAAKNPRYIWDVQELEQKAVASIQSALEFLAPRSAIRSLELINLTFPCFHSLEGLVREVATATKDLRALVVSRWEFSLYKVPRFWSYLSELILSQPNLHTLVLGPFTDWRLTLQEDWPNGFRLPPLLALRHLQHLRVLVLYLRSVEEVCKIEGPVMARLDCLSVFFRQPPTGLSKSVCDYVTQCAPALSVCEHACRSYVGQLVWSKPGLEVEAVMADRALFSCNFILNYQYVHHWYQLAHLSRCFPCF